MFAVPHNVRELSKLWPSNHKLDVKVCGYDPKLGYFSMVNMMTVIFGYLKFK
jgi:hypothetical protein